MILFIKESMNGSMPEDLGLHESVIEKLMDRMAISGVAASTDITGRFKSLLDMPTSTINSMSDTASGAASEEKIEKYRGVLQAISSGDIVAAGRLENEIIAMHGGRSYVGAHLRDLTNEGQLAQTIVEKVLSIALTKKVVLVFDERLGSGQSVRMFRDFKYMILELKKNPKLAKLLQNLIVKTNLESAEAFAGEKDAEVFVFTADEKYMASSGNIHASIINEKGFPMNAYYPLAEIVAITLSNFLDTNTLLEAIVIARKINISSIDLADGRLVFTLLPSAKEHEIQELVQRYARLKDLLRNA